jgi:hypothetical protein
MDTVEQVEQVDEVEALGGRIFEAALGAADILSIYLGDRLGWYRSLADRRTLHRRRARQVGPAPTSGTRGSGWSSRR